MRRQFFRYHFVTLLQARRKNENYRESDVATTSDLTIDVTPEVDDASISELEPLRTKIFEATRRGDFLECQALIGQIMRSDVSLVHASMREPESDKTVLHYALELKHTDIAKYYMELYDYKLLMAKFKVKTPDFETPKTCLHLLVEMGDATLLDYFLKIVVAAPSKQLITTVSICVS